MIRKETRQQLLEVGRKDQTYDDLVSELVAIKKQSMNNACPICGTEITKRSMSRSGFAPAPRHTPTATENTEQSTGGHK